MAGQLLDIGQRGPDEVLDTGLPCGPYGSGADLLSRSLIRFPEIRDDECTVCALECSHETARIEQIRVHHFKHLARRALPRRRSPDCGSPPVL